MGFGACDGGHSFGLIGTAVQSKKSLRKGRPQMVWFPRIAFTFSERAVALAVMHPV
jgi:hypothetical protein